VNGVWRGFVVAGLAAAGLLVTVPGAQPARGVPVGAGLVVSARSSDRLAELFAELPTGATGAKPGQVVAAGTNGIASGRVADVLPRGDAQAPAKRKLGWTPLLILAGLLGTGLGSYLLYSMRRPGRPAAS
jgi:hypothetical protein